MNKTFSNFLALTNKAESVIFRIILWSSFLVVWEQSIHQRMKKNKWDRLHNGDFREVGRYYTCSRVSKDFIQNVLGSKLIRFEILLA